MTPMPGAAAGSPPTREPGLGIHYVVGSRPRSQSAPRLYGGAGSPVVVVQQPGQQLGQPLSLLG